jgi:predicted nucleic acid-binding protein
MTRRPVLFDTSIYIPYLRGEAYTSLIAAASRAGTVRLSTVVLTELYAGTRSRRDKQDLDAALNAFRSVEFLLVPTATDWARTGLAIRRYSRLYGALQPREHMNDVLILVSSAVAGSEVVTENVRPFARWAALLTRTGLPARVREVRRSDYLD